MKICLVSPYDFSVAGGVNDHIMHLAENFRALGHTVKIIAPSSAQVVTEEGADGIVADGDVYTVGHVTPIKANGSVARISLSLNLSGKIKTILRREQFDVVHIHEPLMPALPLTVLAHSRVLNVGTFHAFAQSNIGYYYMRPVLRYFTARLDGRIAVSQPAVDFASRYFPGDYQIIPNGVSLERFKADQKLIPELNDGKLNIMFLGRISETRKGLKYLLRAFSLIKPQLPDVRLIIVGKGKESGYRRYLEKHDIRDVIFTGFVSEEDKPRYYRSVHVFCAPSLGGESFGITLIEAMASGLPIVASDIPGYASVLEHGKQGFLVEPKNKEALARSLVHLLSDAELRRKMGEAASLKADEYNWPKVSKRVLEFYERADNRRRARIRLKRMRHNRRRNYGMGWLLGRRRLERKAAKKSLGEAADSGSSGLNFAEYTLNKKTWDSPMQKAGTNKNAIQPDSRLG